MKEQRRNKKENIKLFQVISCGKIRRCAHSRAAIKTGMICWPWVSRAQVRPADRQWVEESPLGHRPRRSTNQPIWRTLGFAAFLAVRWCCTRPRHPAKWHCTRSYVVHRPALQRARSMQVPSGSRTQSLLRVLRQWIAANLINHNENFVADVFYVLMQRGFYYVAIHILKNIEFVLWILTFIISSGFNTLGFSVSYP